MSVRDKLFTKVQIRPSKNDVKRRIKQKKKQYLEEKLSENIAKQKEFWQTLQSLGLPNKKNSPSNICLKSKNGFIIRLTDNSGNF